MSHLIFSHACSPGDHELSYGHHLSNHGIHVVLYLQQMSTQYIALYSALLKSFVL